MEISPFLENIETYILACNVHIKSAEGIVNIRKSVVFDIQGVKVGIVGYLTPENSMLDNIGNVEYIDEVLALTEEVEKLQASNINIIIALGHSTLEKEKEIAKEVAGIDMVIAGNRNTFHSNSQTGPDVHQPILMTRHSGKQVPIIPSTAYDKYLGSVKVEFNKNGDILEYNVDPILLDSSVPQDSASLEIGKTYYSDVVSRNSEIIGSTSVVLDGESCYREECNFGNFIVDAIMYYYATRYEGERWTDAPIAIIHSGAITGSISPSNRPADVTRGDLLSALSLDSNLVTVTMNGVLLRSYLEEVVSDYGSESSRSSFPQFSGIRVVYDLDQERGSRLISAVVRCWECQVPEFYEIEDGRNYKVLMSTVLADGKFTLPQVTREVLDYDAVTCTEEFIKLRSPVYPEVAGRIVLRGGAGSVVLSSSLLLLALISFALN